jgi:hypothetical protein
MFIVMAGCWIVLLAFVLTSVLQTAKLAKQHRSKRADLAAELVPSSMVQ